MQDGKFQPEKQNTETSKLEHPELMQLEERLGKSMHFDARAEYNHELKGRLLRDLRQQPRQQQKVAFGYFSPRLRAMGGVFASVAVALVIGIVVLTGINMFSASTSIKPSLYAEQSPDLSTVTDVEVVQTQPATTAISQVAKPTQDVYDVESSLTYAKIKRDNLAHSESLRDPSRLLPSPH